eukprot:jgi/Tetstr1/455082/TSEL_041935.t1
MFGKSDVPRYIVNLDAPPRERWTRVIAAHRHHFPAVVDVVKGILGSGAVKGLVESFFALLARSGHLYFGEELQGIADASGLPLGSIVLLQIAYELFAGCTSIVAQSDTHPVHIRTMDWDMDALKPLTCEVEMVRNGRIVFVATTWAGYVGILTGLSPGAFSVSVNYRCTEKVDIIKQILLQNLLSRGLLRRHWPVSFLVRQALESCSSFADAVAALEHSQLMAPVYFTICGTDSGQGIVLARDRAGGSCSSTCLAWPSYRHPMRSGSHSSADDGPLGGTWETALAELDLAVEHSRAGSGRGGGPACVVQANMDIDCDGRLQDPDAVGSAMEMLWQDIGCSRHRRQFALAALAASQAAPATALLDDLWLLATTPPVLGELTIYTTAMVPATGLLVTRLNASHRQQRAAASRFGSIASAVAKAQEAWVDDRHRAGLWIDSDSE